MNVKSPFITQSTFSSFTSTTRKNSFIEKLVENLSIVIAESTLDLMNVGICVYDPFTIEEIGNRKGFNGKFNRPRAISLRSKSTRNLKVRKRRRNLS
jgi:hypothetical protein